MQDSIMSLIDSLSFVLNPDLEANTVYLDSIKVPLGQIFSKETTSLVACHFLKTESISKSPPFFSPLHFLKGYIVSEAGAILPFLDHTELFGDQISAV